MEQPPQSAGTFTRNLNLWVHESNFSKEDVILNPDCIPGVKPGQLLELFHPNASADQKKHFVFRVSSPDKEIFSKKPACQVSVAKHIASLFDFKNRNDVVARVVDAESVSAEFIELTFRDQYIGRSEMWRLSRSLIDTCVYVGSNIRFADCIRAQVKKIYVKGEFVPCGYVTEETKPTFRSESAKYFIFVQMSREMWEFDEDGELFFEKAIDGFLPELFRRWKELGANHVVSIVLFSRIFYDYDEDIAEEDIVEEGIEQLDDRRFYKDFYKVIVDWETHSDWTSVIVPLKEELLKYPQDILLRKKGGNMILTGKNSFAFEGNILEAINLALNPFDRHYIDRDLLRTGLAIIIVTPGSGRFDVNKKLLRMTTERMTDNGIGLDLVCLSRIPLHTVPLFKFRSQNPVKIQSSDWHNQRSSGGGGTGMNNKAQSKDVKPESRDSLYYDEDITEATVDFYRTPDWIDCSFYARYQDKPYKPDKFVTRCKMYEIQMMGIMEHEISSMLIPYLDDDKLEFEPITSPPGSTSALPINYDGYDERIFDTERRPNKPREFSHSVAANRHHSGAELSKSLPKTMATSSVMSAIHHDSFNNRTNRISCATSDDGTGHHLSKISSSAGDDHIKKFPNISMTGSDPPHDIYNEGIGIGGGIGGHHIVDDDGTVLTSSTVKPISIKASTRRPARSQHRESSPSPKNSFADNLNFKPSNSSDKGRHFFKQSPGKFLVYKPYQKQTLINPCNPVKNRPETGNHLKRWEHVSPKRLFKNTVEWTSLCTPACLPLTTDYFPPINELGTYSEYAYAISANPEGFVVDTDDNTSEERRTEILLNEMISQRLAQGYQLIMPSNTIENTKGQKGIESILVKSLTETGKSAIWKEQQQMSNSPSASPPYYLSMGHNVHELTYGSSKQGVAVKIYIRNVQYKTDPIPYNCVVWPKFQEKYEKRNLRFSYPHSNYKWNHVDQFVSGYQDYLLENVPGYQENLKFWRTKFIMIPMENVPTVSSNENLDEEELRVIGIRNLLDIFQKAIWIPPNEPPELAQKKKNEKLTLITLDPTLDLSVYLGMPDGAPKRSSVYPSDERLNKDSKLSTIAQLMANSATGIVRERRWRFQTYENAIVGHETVDWLIKNFFDIDTREVAVEFGNKLKEKNLFNHCTGRHPFLDGHYFYQLTKEYSPQKTTKGNQKAVTKDLEKDSPQQKILDEKAQSQHKGSKVELSRAIQIDIDPNKKSGRKETAILHYDVFYIPDNCYHFQLNWLGCTARLIEDLLQSWNRNAGRCGLKLVEAPVEQPMSLPNNNPFQSPTIIKLALQPPSLEALGKKLDPAISPYLYFETELVKKFRFILDVEADDRFPKDVEVIYSYYKTPYKYSQYIHRSGVAFIQIREPGNGYLWVNNRLVTTQTTLPGATSKAPPATDPDALLREFQNFCRNDEELKRFWAETASKLPEMKIG